MSWTSGSSNWWELLHRHLEGTRVTVMGLGLHGGGVAAARYCARHGASVTVTDLQDEHTLESSLRALDGLKIRYVLGRHDPGDFADADIILKNPAVPRSAPLLKSGPAVETDLSLFFARHAGPIAAITGTKGKSTTASMLHHLIRSAFPSARLGGNITVSPLEFVDEIDESTPVVLELSSFQLGDLLLSRQFSDGLPAFKAAAITNLMPDHQNYYPSMDAYWTDKALIASGLLNDSLLVLAGRDRWCEGFTPETTSRVVRRDDLVSHPMSTIVRRALHIPGEHSVANATVAALMALEFGLSNDQIEEAISTFPGVPHRLETVGTLSGVRVINDSAATIAEAALAAVRSFDLPVHLICGGSEKRVGFEPFRDIAHKAATIHLLDGTATPFISSVLSAERTSFTGPHASLAEALESARAAATAGDVILLSPGCASFGMFQNEFDRGDQFRALVQSVTA